MSLQHILGTARKLGIPVVITNDRGESPQVVMPFEDFASMVGVQMSKTPQPQSRREIVTEQIEDDFSDLNLDEIEEIPMGDLSELEREEIGEIDREGDGKEEGKSLEDEFYFEPIDDKERQ